jgi:hypothetical protein
MMDLSGLRTLGAEAARMLAGLRTPNLVINGLPTLDAASATALADFKGQHLELGGLESLDADAARALAKSKAWDGRFLKLTTLDAPTAEALAERGGNSLMFDRLAALDADTAQALAAFKGNLFLQSLTRLLVVADSKSTRPGTNGVVELTAFEFLDRLAGLVPSRRDECAYPATRMRSPFACLRTSGGPTPDQRTPVTDESLAEVSLTVLSFACSARHREARRAIRPLFAAHLRPARHWGHARLECCVCRRVAQGHQRDREPDGRAGAHVGGGESGGIQRTV